MNIPFKVFEAPEITPFTFSTSRQVYDNMKDYSKADREIFLVLHLNAKNGLINCETQSVGTVDSSAVYPREIIKSAIMFNALSLIFIHNHPTGDPKPSEQDKELTKQLTCGCKFMSIQLLDHVILGRNGFFSFADEGLIDDYERYYKQHFAF